MKVFPRYDRGQNLNQQQWGNLSAKAIIMVSIVLGSCSLGILDLTFGLIPSWMARSGGILVIGLLLEIGLVWGIDYYDSRTQ